MNPDGSFTIVVTTMHFPCCKDNVNDEFEPENMLELLILIREFRAPWKVASIVNEEKI